MELAILIDSDGTEYSQVTRRLRYKDGMTIVKTGDKPNLDTHMYEM